MGRRRRRTLLAPAIVQIQRLESERAWYVVPRSSSLTFCATMMDIYYSGSLMHLAFFAANLMCTNDFVYA